MPSHPRLPADVVHCVFGEVIKIDDSRKWVLQKCSLVCQEWCVVARPLLFSKISIGSPWTGIRFYEFFHFIGSRPELARYIQSLNLQEGGDYKTYLDRHRRTYTQSDESYVQCRSIAPAGSVEGDGRRRQSAPRLYGPGTPILDYPALLSVLPHFTGLRSLHLRNIALWWEEGTILEPPPALPLVRIVVDAVYCSLPCLLTGLQSARLESMHLEDFDFSSRVGVDSPLNQQSEDTWNRGRYTPSKYFEYPYKPIDFSALQYLSIRPPLTINVRSLCAFLRTLGGAGILFLRLDLQTDLHSRSDTIPNSPEVSETLWDAVGNALKGFKKLNGVILKVPVHSPADSRTDALLYDPEHDDSSLVEMAAPRTFSMLPDITSAVTAVLAHPAAPFLRLNLVRDRDLGYMSMYKRHRMEIMAPRLLEDLSVLDDICFEQLQPPHGFADDRHLDAGACRHPERYSALGEDERPLPRLSIAVEWILVPWAGSCEGRVEAVLRAMPKLGRLSSDLLHIQVY